MIDLALIEACAPPAVSAETIAQIIEVESGGKLYALHVNIPGDQDGKTIQPENLITAAAEIRKALAAGYTVDVGLMQVNSTTAVKLGYLALDMLDPCKNIAAGAATLKQSYKTALQIAQPGQDALQAALSLYNTGDAYRGFRNGYVAKFYNFTATPAPASAEPDEIDSDWGSRAQSPFDADMSVFHRSENNEPDHPRR